MKFYIKNTDTNEIITIAANSYESLSKNFRQAPYELASDSEKGVKILEEAKAAKKEEITKARNSEFAKPLQVRSNPDVYLRPQPQVNIFLAAYSMNDGATKEWAPCDKDGNMQDTEVAFTKEELVSASNHYEERKTTQYNQARRRCRAVDVLTTIEEVEAYDITTVYE